MPGVADNEWVTRFLPTRAAKVDVADDRHLTGLAIVFGSLSQDLGGFRERIAPEAVDRTLRSGANVDALLDHRREVSALLGSTDSGLLRLTKERHGLSVRISPPDTQPVRDLMTLVRAGLVRGMSFSFKALDDDWEMEDVGVVRTVKDMIFSEVSVVTNPAYLATEISARNHELDKRALDTYLAERKWRPSLAFRERALRVYR